MGIALLISFQNNTALTSIIILLFTLVTLPYLSAKKALVLFLLLTLSASGVFVTGLFFYQEQQPGEVTKAAVQYGLDMALRIYCLGILGTAFTATTEMIDLMYSLQQQLKVPPLFAYGLLAAFQIGPIIPSEMKHIKNSMRSRGIRIGLLHIPIMVPLLVKSIRWSELLADAMTSRGFDGHQTRTYVRQFHLSIIDYMLMSFCILGGVLGTIFL